jgi:hypothetical protein
VRSFPILPIPVPTQGGLSVSHFELLSFQVSGKNVVATVTSHRIHQRHSFELGEATDWTGINPLIAERVAVVC